MNCVKRILCCFLAVCLALVLPLPVQAADTQSHQVQLPAQDGVLSNDERFAGYVASVFYPDSGISPQGTGETSARARLTGDEALAYDALVPIIKQIAAGERTSTSITLGEGDDMDVYISFQGDSRDFDLNQMLGALLMDHPYELYWYDQYNTGHKYLLYHYSQSHRLSCVEMHMSVAPKYREDEADAYTTDRDKATAATRAAANARKIADKYADASDYEKHRGFWQEILDLVEYEHDYAGAKVDIDPWQIIYVFDGDPQTDVVCAGYAKAYQYLCDLSGLVCYYTVGILGNGYHAWNTVTLGGKNYMVDVTGSEADTVGFDGSLFLAGAVGDPLTGYTFTNSNGQKTTYYCSEDTVEQWGMEAMTLDERNYNGCDHTDEVVVVPPTCTEQGYTAHTCTKCGSSYQYDFVPATGHDFADGGCRTCGALLGGTCGSGLTWAFAPETGVLTISGTGRMENYWKNEANTTSTSPWSSLSEAITSVVIQEGVTSVGSAAFYKCGNLVSVTMADSVTAIGQTAFYDCTSLPTIRISAGVTDLAGFTFFGCSALKTVTLPDNLTSIGSSAFYKCSALEEIHIPDGVTSIPDHTFAYCGSLKSVSIPDGVTELGLCAFDHCVSLTEVVLPSALTSLGDYAFSDNTALTRISFTSNAPTIGEYAFLKVTAEARYPVNTTGWYKSLLQNYGGNLTWIVYDPSNPFTDVPYGTFYHEPVLWAVEHGITNGTSATTFGPNDPCMRAHVVTFLWRAAGSPEPETTHNPFVDVKQSDFYYKAVLWAVETGITNGLDATHFGPLSYCNRAQVVTFLWRAQGCPEPATTVSPFTDVVPGAFYDVAVLWAVENGITNGTSATAFSPAAACNRGQIVTFLYRAFAS